FRRQLQSDPAAALRGFNLTPDEVAAIRSGDSGKLMSLGVDQRMSKAFTVSGGLMGATRSTTSDLGVGGTASTVANDNTAGTREGLVGDPTSGARQGIVGDPTSGSREALTTGNFSGTRAVNDSAPFDSRATVSDPTAAGTRAIHDDAPADLRGAVSTGDFAGNTRAVNDVAPFEGNVNAAATDGGAGAAGGAMLSADDNYAVSSRMADAGDATSIRPINDVAPFEGNANAVAPTGEFLGGDARLDAGTDSAHGFIPSDSADVQREMLDGSGHGDALGNTGGGGNTSS
ncbi:MAG: Os1348 family NHLP clan protein, partial [Mycobacteriales bacterium]